MKLIDKAEVIKSIEELDEFWHLSKSPDGQAFVESLFSFLNDIEEKEVDLEKEINKYISDNFFGSETMGFFATRTKEEPNDIDIALCAKYFYQLGLAQKGE